jgi:hypothetical protein
MLLACSSNPNIAAIGASDKMPAMPVSAPNLPKNYQEIEEEFLKLLKK